MSQTVEWLAGINALLGAWLVAIPFLFADAIGVEAGFAFWNYLLTGGAILLLSGYNWYVADEDDPGSTAAASLSAVLGLWVIVTPFLTEVAADGWLLWNGIVVGAIVTILAAYNAYEAADTDRDVATTTT